MTMTVQYFCFFCTKTSKDKDEFYHFISETLCEFLICKKCVNELIEGFEEWLSEQELKK